ncbi:hypothetical protein BS50DRAFT_594483 [Corynespora cassiicola Philippines]|uniref:Uncharacterized protein n=1 Tax=Corynespora cassiicola Philippines TaxID=1448308 RepID=A0A2T2N2H0_CORCC|nr:hypothetical protein BS50DRAFT_594483 [Corynespora cassiicola Philippines]
MEYSKFYYKQFIHILIRESSHPTAEEWKKYPDGNFLIDTPIIEEYVASYSMPWLFSDQWETWEDWRVNGGVVNSGVWILNKAITEDIMYVTNVFQLFTCIFGYRLSEKRAYWNCSRYRRDQNKREDRKSWSRMATSPMMFSFLSHISIDHVGICHDEFQSGPAVMRRRRDLKILKHVETIRFITKHRPRIKIFGFNHNTMDLVRFESNSESDSESGFVEVASNKGKEALVFAFWELVQKWPGLVTLKRSMSQGHEIYRGTEHFVTSFLNFYASVGLDLSLMPEYERQDRTERWVREGMKAHRESQYNSIGDIYW